MSGESENALAALPPLRDALAEHGLLAKKAFGQHFLLDLNITRKIARLAELSPGDRVIEVGPGPGGLTRALLEVGACVVAVEKDQRFRPLLEDLARAAAPGALTLDFADALTVDEAALTGGAPGRVVSNLPYNVGTALLIKWLTGPWTPASMTLMFQKEVAQRIAADVDTGAYGRLAVIAQATCEAQTVMDVPARAFTPPPKVESAVVRLTPRPDRPSPARLDALQKLTAAAFGQRRKMLRASLKGLGGEPLIEAAGLDPQARAETVDVAGFLRLADSWLARR
ncbi:MAG TPA: 16S rRNA (adenine(1518)-N(6)/adenine(1519)-N(6))-dimethyltransferase RsmA [Phenylobacterium sp.]|uniref:16S rRNA (adenine(1518)-N(6)/adenine(1519)-N(6))- dimethyltransferase RsmA n=1 Tax=Phenylobacterium sp. TaxID=1871053 RepID=UPI002D2FC1A2|nr:16S rRNA (adenine(1518)-N(6)/adenine(1519)-N(6))-dimethyltransferase RsmA [Phenylobacterium sp.]HZZ67231.1 16S rRNA (adenine(1518)-N(6)/adenine(1519)-N(6))-dimethyltransferase RsmA [Phenylobacterium sp.]